MKRRLEVYHSIFKFYAIVTYILYIIWRPRFKWDRHKEDELDQIYQPVKINWEDNDRHECNFYKSFPNKIQHFFTFANVLNYHVFDALKPVYGAHIPMFRMADNET